MEINVSLYLALCVYRYIILKYNSIKRWTLVNLENNNKILLKILSIIHVLLLQMRANIFLHRRIWYCHDDAMFGGFY